MRACVSLCCAYIYICYIVRLYQILAYSSTKKHIILKKKKMSVGIGGGGGGCGGSNGGGGGAGPSSSSDGGGGGVDGISLANNAKTTVKQQQKKVCFICGSHTTFTINIYEPRSGPNIVDVINQKFKVQVNILINN